MKDGTEVGAGAFDATLDVPMSSRDTRRRAGPTYRGGFTDA